MKYFRNVLLLFVFFGCFRYLYRTHTSAPTQQKTPQNPPITHLTGSTQSPKKKHISITPLTTLKTGLSYNEIVSVVPSSGVDIEPPSWFQPSNTIDISYWTGISPDPIAHNSYLVIPRLGMITPVLHHTYTGDLAHFDQKELDALFLSGSASYPQMAKLGEFGNSLIGAHSSYFFKDKSDYRTIFIRLPELEVGDEVWGYTHTGDNNRQWHRYHVSQSYAMGTFSQDIVTSYSDKKEITLYTCIPIGTNKDRWIIKTTHIGSYDLSDVLEHGSRSSDTAPKLN